MAIEVQTNMSLEAAPSDPSHVVHVKWVEEYFTSKIKEPVRVISTSNIAGDYDDEEQTFTLDTDGPLIVDGVELLSGDRILIAGQADATQNGIYTIAIAGATGTEAQLARADDFNTDDMVYPGVRVAVDNGTRNNNTTWKLVSNSDIIIDTTPLTFVKFASLAATSKFSFTIEGDGVEKDFVIQHNLNTTDIKISVTNVTTGSMVWADTTINDADSVTVSFANPPAVGKNYRVIINGYRKLRKGA